MLAIGLGLVALVQAGVPAVPRVDPSNDIVVEGQRLPDAPQARRFTNALTRRADSTVPFARFTTPICVGAAGLPAAHLAAISDRIVRVALDAGIAVAAEGCRPTILVVFADAPAVAIERLRLRSAGLFGNLDLSQIRAITARKGAAYAWTTAEVRNRDGQPVMRLGGGAPQLTVHTASTLQLPYRRDMIASVVLFDRAAIVGRGIGQLADYAAMRALTGVDPVDARGTDSILTLFDAPTAPDRITPLDAAFLRGFYAGPANIAALAKRGQITTAMTAVAKTSGR